MLCDSVAYFCFCFSYRCLPLSLPVSTLQVRWLCETLAISLEFKKAAIVVYRNCLATKCKCQMTIFQASEKFLYRATNFLQVFIFVVILTKIFEDLQWVYSKSHSSKSVLGRLVHTRQWTRALIVLPHPYVWNFYCLFNCCTYVVISWKMEMETIVLRKYIECYVHICSDNN